MLLSKLFLNCYNGINYQTAGDSVNYAFVEDKDTLYIYFQGSSQISDWVRNFLFKKRPYTLTEWLKRFGFSQLDEEAIKSFFSECISFPSGYYWDVTNSGNRSTSIAAGYFNKRTEKLDEDREITIDFYGNEKPIINYPTYYSSFVRWAKRVEKKVNDLVDTFYIASMKNDNNDTK